MPPAKIVDTTFKENSIGGTGLEFEAFFSRRNFDLFGFSHFGFSLWSAFSFFSGSITVPFLVSWTIVFDFINSKVGFF